MPEYVPCHRRQTLKNSDEEIRVADESPISEMMLSAVARFPEKKVGFRHLAHHGQRRQYIGADTNNNHLNAAESLRKTCMRE